MSRQPAANKLPLKNRELRGFSLKKFKNERTKQLSFRTRHSVPLIERETQPHFFLTVAFSAASAGFTLDAQDTSQGETP